MLLIWLLKYTLTGISIHSTGREAGDTHREKENESVKAIERVCVRERERERERKKGGKRERERRRKERETCQ